MSNRTKPPVSLSEAVAHVMASRSIVEARDEKDAAAMGVSVDEMHEQRKRASEIERRTAILIRSRIPITRADLREIVSGKHRQTDARKYISDWAAHDGSRSILILCGHTGTGKTYAAACAIMGYGSGIAIAAADLAARMRPTPMEREAGVSQVDIDGAGLIVLDDLGTEKLNDRWAESFLRFIDARALHGMTIITSNLERSEIVARYDQRVISRLRAACHVREVRCEDMRGKGEL